MTPLTPAKQKMVEDLTPALEAIAAGMGMRDDVDVAYLAAVKAAAVWDEPGRVRHGVETTFVKFAKQCARFALMRHRKKESRHRHAPIELHEPAAEPGITARLECLSDFDRKIFVAKFVKGCSVKTIGSWMRVSPKKVYASLARSVDQLSEALCGTTSS